MKKCAKFIVIVLCLTLILSACELIDEISPKIDAPVLSVVGNVILWDKVEKAEKYAVYCNETQITTTTEQFYSCGEMNATKQFYVVAMNADESKVSEQSNKVVVYQNTGFKETETMNIELESNKVYNVPSNILCVNISGTAQYTSIKIAERTSDITITLDNVNMVSKPWESCIATADGAYDVDTLKYSVCIFIKGDNQLTGESDDYIPGSPSTNSGKKGKKGNDGSCGIILPKVAFNGNGSLVLQGSDGGNGAGGADSDGWLSTAVYGDGGNGGTGGYGIKCTNAVLNMAISGICKAYGGKGGKGGSPGSNGSVLTGPWATSGWDKHFGKDGEDGAGVLGTMVQISGTFME